MTEVVKDYGFALVYPVTLGYVCNPVPVELHVSPLSARSSPPRILPLPGRARQRPSSRPLRGDLCIMLDANLRELAFCEVGSRFVARKRVQAPGARLGRAECPLPGRDRPRRLLERPAGG